jgi:hypothetical protein
MLYRGRTSAGPRPDQVYSIPFTSVSSFVLLMSSLTMVLAVSAAKDGDIRRTRVWLTTTALLGSTFVGGQIFEFTTFYRKGLGFTTSLFGSSFYTLTGFHGVHVSVGVVLLLSLVAMEPPARFDANAVRSEKADALDALHVPNEAAALQDSVRAQYVAARVGDNEVEVVFCDKAFDGATHDVATWFAYYVADEKEAHGLDGGRVLMQLDE